MNIITASKTSKRTPYILKGLLLPVLIVIYMVTLLSLQHCLPAVAANTISATPKTAATDSGIERTKQNMPLETTYLKRGRDYCAHGQWQNALDAFNQAIKLNPDYPAAYFNRGGAYTCLMQPEKGIEDYTMAINLSRNDKDTKAASYVQRAGAYIVKARGDEYKRVREKAAAIKRGEFHITVSDIMESDTVTIARYIQAFNNGEYIELDGNALPGKELYQKAIQDCNLAISHANQWRAECNYNFVCERAYLNRAQASMLLGEYQKALNDCNYAINLGATDAYITRGEVSLHLKRWQNAINDFTKAIGLNLPDIAHCYEMRGVAFSHIGQYQKAIDDTNKAIDLGQGGFTRLNLVVSYRELGRHQRAIEEFGKLTHDETVDGSAERCYYNFAMNAHPKEAWPYAGRGNASVKMATYFRRLAGLPPEPTSQSQLRLQAKISEFYTAAIEDCSIAIALDPKFAQAYATRGIAYRELKQSQKAVEDFKKAVSLNPSLAQQIALDNLPSSQ